MVEFKYNTGNKEVFYDHAMYSKFVYHNNKKFINIKGTVSGNNYYEVNLGQDNKLYDKDFNVTNQKTLKINLLKIYLLKKKVGVNGQ